MTSSRSLFKLAPVCALLAAGSAFATNGYFPHGYGMKAKGMGGASVAMTDNAFAGANNPAIAAWAGNRMEGGVDLFMPNRSIERAASTAGLNATADSDSKLFLVPEFGYNRALNESLGVGVTVYGNGGMNTNFPGGQLNCGGGAGTGNMLCGAGSLGVDLMQLIVAPTVAYKLSGNHSVGISPLLVYQIFKANGLQMFSAMSGVPGSVTNNGYDSGSGIGVRLGYLGKLSDSVSIGASYSPKISMSKFSKYAGLFANGGSFDIPENYSLGASFKATPALTLALDYEHISYAKVASVGNPSTNAAPLGAVNGPGFGWSDVNAWKLGVQWQTTSQLTMRAGINVGKNPIQSRDVTFNMLAPGVITTHYTLGGTYALSPSTELTVAAMYAPKKAVTGASMFNSPALLPPGGMGGNETISMSQKALGVQFGWHW